MVGGEQVDGAGHTGVGQVAEGLGLLAELLQAGVVGEGTVDNATSSSAAGGPRRQAERRHEGHTVVDISSGGLSPVRGPARRPAARVGGHVSGRSRRAQRRLQASGWAPSTSVKPYSVAELGGGDATAGSTWPRSGVGGQGGDGAADDSAATRMRRSRAARSASRRRGRAASASRQLPSRHAEVVEHHLRAQPAGREGDGGCAVGRQLVALREGEAVHGDLRQVVEDRDAVVSTRCTRSCRR